MTRVAVGLTGALMPAATLLGRLEGVRDRGDGRWLARCPAHKDHTPSLSLRELGDGTVLLKCFSGCSAAEVVASVGLQMSDLFPEQLTDHRGKPVRRHERPAIGTKDLVRLLRHGMAVTALAARDLAHGRPLSDNDRETLLRVQGRLERVLREVAP